jgi:DNA processing protein
MDDAVLRLAFAGLAPRRVDALVERFGTVEAAVSAIVRGGTDLDRSVVGEVAVSAATRRDQLGTAGIDFTTRDQAGFPRRLAGTAFAPRWLFTIGDPSIARAPTVAIVGTRTCTTYGQDLAFGYGVVASSMGWCVVSGLAKGIDGAAHQGSLSVGGRCVAVLGCGVDVVYPRRHRGLYGAITGSGGAVVSEFPPGTPPHAWRFPTRNRIIAGMADVVLVVEANVSGGALITASLALDMGIPVFATPGDVDRPASMGTNLLIRDGAFPVFGGDDLAEVLDLIVPGVPSG